MPELTRELVRILHITVHGLFGNLSLLSMVALPILVRPLFQDATKTTVYISAKIHFGSFLVSKMVVSADFNLKTLWLCHNPFNFTVI